jgi:transposase
MHNTAKRKQKQTSPTDLASIILPDQEMMEGFRQDCAKLPPDSPQRRKIEEILNLEAQLQARVKHAASAATENKVRHGGECGRSNAEHREERGRTNNATTEHETVGQDSSCQQAVTGAETLLPDMRYLTGICETPVPPTTSRPETNPPDWRKVYLQSQAAQQDEMHDAEQATRDWGDAGAEHAGSLRDAALTHEQHLALDHLFRGASLSEAARRAGVDRRTVQRWVKLPLFQAEFQRQQNNLSAEQRARLAALAQKAVDAIAASMRQGDARAALALLKAVHLLPTQSLTTAAQDHPGTPLDYPVSIEQHPATPETKVAQPEDQQPEDQQPEAQRPEAQRPEAQRPETSMAAECFEGQDSSCQEAVSGADKTNPGIRETTDTSEKESLESRCVELEDLSRKQQIAMGYLLEGYSLEAVAKEAFVLPVTLRRWLRQDPAFQQVLRNTRAETEQRIRQQLAQHIPLAIRLLERALIDHDHRIALTLLKSLGMFRQRAA